MSKEIALLNNILNLIEELPERSALLADLNPLFQNPLQKSEEHLFSLRRQLQCLISDNENSLSDQDKKNAKIAYEALLNLAECYPINDTDYITLENIPDDKKVFTSTGKQFHLETLAQFHNERLPHREAHEDFQNKWIIDPSTNLPFSKLDSEHITRIAQEKNISLTNVMVPQSGNQLDTLNEIFQSIHKWENYAKKSKKLHALYTKIGLVEIPFLFGTALLGSGPIFLAVASVSFLTALVGVGSVITYIVSDIIRDHHLKRLSRELGQNFYLPPPGPAPEQEETSLPRTNSTENPNNRTRAIERFTTVPHVSPANSSVRLFRSHNHDISENPHRPIVTSNDHSFRPMP